MVEGRSLGAPRLKAAVPEVAPVKPLVTAASHPAVADGSVMPGSVSVGGHEGRGQFLYSGDGVTAEMLVKWRGNG